MTAQNNELKGDLPVLRTPAVESVECLLKEAITLNCISVVSGINGVGKTTALRMLERQYKALGLGGTALYHLASGGSGPSRAVKDILSDMGVREALIQTGMPLHLSVKHAMREFERREVRVLLLDDADNWGGDALRGLVTLFDQCRAQNRPVAMILAGALPPDRWIVPVAAAMSRTLRTETLIPLSPEMMVAIFKQWGGPLGKLAEKAAEGDKKSASLIRKIHRITLGGRFRRISYFAGLVGLYATGEVDETLTDTVAAKLGEAVTTPSNGQ